MKTGKIIQIIGPVVDVEFESGTDLPQILNALTVQREKETITLEVAKHLEPGRLRAIALSSTDGLQRGAEVKDTGAPISVPVGTEVLGKIFNVLGFPIEENEKNFKAKKTLAYSPFCSQSRRSIHQDRSF
jgi:F-type H+-transporting ATPase subunit beta